MNLTLDGLRLSFGFFRRRFGLDVEMNEPAAGAALSLLDSLSQAEEDRAAAVFYAFARHPRAFPGAARAFTTLLARGAACHAGQIIMAEDAEMGGLLFDVAAGVAGYEYVRGWFAARVRPSGT